MKILHVTAPAAYGGLERVVEALARGHRQRGIDVAVALVYEPGASVEPFATGLADHGVRTFPVEVPARSYQRERQLIADICRSWKADLLHTHGYHSDVLMGRVASALGIPHVATAHGFTGGDWKNRLYEALQRRAFRRCAAVVAVSGRLGERLRVSGVRAERVRVIPNAWGETSVPLDREQARAELGISGGPLRLGWVGRVSREKGADVLVSALELLDDLPLAVSFIGDGPEAAELRARTARLQAEGRVRWHGAVPDAGRLLPAFDAFVLSSRTEGTPIALLEAVAAGVPVIATTVGGVPDVVGENQALLVTPESPAALAAAIRELHSDPESAVLRAASASDRLRREFALDPWLERYESMYRELCPQYSSTESCKA